MTHQATPDFNAELARQAKATENAQALADQYKQSADKARESAMYLTSKLAEVDRARIAAGARADAAEAERDDLVRLVGAETPIAAFTLAVSWQSEKARMLDRIDELTQKNARLTLERDAWQRRAEGGV